MASMPQPLSLQSLASALQRCRQTKDRHRAKLLYGYARQHQLDSHAVIGNRLVAMLVDCGCLPNAQLAFDGLLHPDERSWSSLITGYADSNDPHHAFHVYHKMQQGSAQPSSYTFLALLRACARIADVRWGCVVHSEIVGAGLEQNTFLGNNLIDMYGKCRLSAEAQRVLEKLPVRDVVSWNALIAGYAEEGLSDEALSSLVKMQLEGISPSRISFICCLKACGSAGALETGQEIHVEIMKSELDSELSVGNSLVDMYGKCGAIVEARKVFNRMPVRNVVTWSAMIHAYGENHESSMALHCYEDMLAQGVKPDAVTFTCLLVACSQANLVLEGQKYFNKMREEHRIEPRFDHLICMVDLLARSGLVYEAERFAEAMLCFPSKEVLTALLSACKMHGEVEVGLRCFQQLVQISEENSAAYMLMADVYASAGKPRDASRIHEMRILAEATKKHANASIEVNKKLHEFVGGENQSKEFLATLGSLSLCMKEDGYVPNLDAILRRMLELEKEATSYYDNGVNCVCV